MSTNSVVIKTGIFTEWFQPHLIPWFMYVPSKLDFSDLADIMAFFTGSPGEPGLAFDETAKALGQNGKCFVQRMFRYEDLQAYMLRLFLEYARIVADEGDDMDYHHEVVEGEDDGQFGEDLDDGVDTIHVPVDSAISDTDQEDIGTDSTNGHAYHEAPSDAEGDAHNEIPPPDESEGQSEEEITPARAIIPTPDPVAGIGTDDGNGTQKRPGAVTSDDGSVISIEVHEGREADA